MAESKITTRNKLIVLTAVMASLLEIIDTSIVNVAVPTMMGNLGATLDEISWVITGYIIANAVVLPIAGWMSEQIGRKTYYTGCILLFTASSIACGLAPSLTTLVIFRVIQGFAGGALLPTSQALIYESFPKEQAGMASAIYGMSVMIGPTIGPTLGGYLTDNFGWRSIFNINVPIGLAVAVLSYLLVEDVGYDPVAAKANAESGKPAPVIRKVRAPIDTWGLAFLVTGIASLQYVLERGHAEDWFDSKSITFFLILGVGCIASLIWWELRTKHPILQLRHFKNAAFRSGVFLMFALGCMLYGLIFVLPVFANIITGLTATQTGELFIPGALCSAMMMPFIGQQLRKRDPRVLIFIGVMGLAGAVLLIGRFDAMTSVDGMFWPLMLRGVAMSFLFVPINTVVLTQFTGAAIGEAAGMLNLCRQLGGSICIATLSSLMARFQVQTASAMSNHLTKLDPAATRIQGALTSAFHTKFSSAIGLDTNSMASLRILEGLTQKQAFVLGYQKVLWIAAGMFLILALTPLIFMKRPKTAMAGPIDAH